MSFYSPPKPWALLPIRLVDTARDVNEMQRGIRLASHLQCVPPLSPPPLFLCLTVLLSGCLWCCVSVSPFTDLLLSLVLSHPPHSASSSPPPLRASPWLGSQLLSPQTPHIPALPWLPACIPGHGDSTGSHNPRQLADLGWASDSQKQGRGEEQRGYGKTE